MRYEFYDRQGKLLGRRRSPEGAAINRDKETTRHFEAQTATRWKAIAVPVPVDGVQKAAVRPI